MTGALVILSFYLLLLANIRSTVTQMGGEMTLLSADVRELELDVQELQDKWESLRRPKRLEKLAHQMKLAPPKAEKVIVIDGSN